MFPSRFMLIDERSPYPVKRRVRGPRDEKGSEPAITLLPPDPYLIMERPDFSRSSSPTMYRTAPPKSAKNKEASSFVILGETVRTPVQSRPASPSGRISPFRGRGFKSPTTTRPNSRAPSPSESPRKSLPVARSGKSIKSLERPRISRDIGLPPKSPMKFKSKQSQSKISSSSVGKVSLEKPEPKVESEEEKKKVEEATVNDNDEITRESKTDEYLPKREVDETTETKEKDEVLGDKNAETREIEENDEEKENSEKINGTKIKNENTKETDEPKKKDENLEAEPKNEKTETKKKNTETDRKTAIKLKAPEAAGTTNFTKSLKQTGESSSCLPDVLHTSKTKPKSKVITPKDKRPPIPSSLKPKTKVEKIENVGEDSLIKRTAKPPIPPKKIGLKTTLKVEDSANEQDKKIKKDLTKLKAGAKENIRPKEQQTKEVAQLPSKEDSKQVKSANMMDSKRTEEENTPKVDPPKADNSKEDAPGAEENKAETKKVTEDGVEERKSAEKNPERLVPCFQPDKCQIAPPTMASPSPIIAPTISTPSTTSELAPSSTKSSQSIATAPTTVTPSSLSSVSSTVVLTGNLVRKEIENRSKSKKAETETDREKDVEEGTIGAANPPNKDSVKWSRRDSLSGEITSTKVIEAEPEMEVLSPNGLRDVPPRMPPPNAAWSDGRQPNGDVPNNAETGGKFRRAISALWRFLGWLFCCRCFDGSRCCRRPSPKQGPEPQRVGASNSSRSKGKCCRNPFKCCFARRESKLCENKKCFRNPFECCLGGCKSKCCEGKKCCRKKPKPANTKSKSRKCCAKVDCSCRGCCNKLKTGCLNAREKCNGICRSLFCLNMMCCQKFLKKFKCCHGLKCCQKGGCCSCCNPNVKKEANRLHKKGSRASNNSRDKDNLDLALVEHTSMMKAAIPVLPSCLAVFCLILNLFVPGLGTFISGILCLCFGKPRFSVRDTPKNRFSSFILNTIIGVAQLFTVVFCLVGWGWSIWWGVIMYKLSRRQKRLKLAEKNQKEAEGSTVNHNHVDVEQG